MLAQHRRRARMHRVANLLGARRRRLNAELLGKPPPRHHVLQHELGHSRSADVAVADEKDANGRLGHGEILCKETDCLKDTAHIISQQPPSP